MPEPVSTYDGHQILGVNQHEMNEVVITKARSAQDVLVVSQLCRDFVTYILSACPEQRERILTYFEPERWEKTLNALPEIHARTTGDILLTWMVSRWDASCITRFSRTLPR